jgi:hypothetical protein
MAKQPNEELLQKQYELAASLYVHEDNLNWSKLNNLFYITSALGALVFLFISNADKFYGAWYGIAIVSLVGGIACWVFRVALRSGTDYLAERKRKLTEIDHLLSLRTSIEVLPDSNEESDTAKLLRKIPMIIFGLWLLVLIVSIINIIL